jgi:hypothetical protein
MRSIQLLRCLDSLGSFRCILRVYSEGVLVYSNGVLGGGNLEILLLNQPFIKP